MTLQTDLLKTLHFETIDRIDVHTIDPILFEKIPYAFAKKHLLIPLSLDDQVLKVALADPLNLTALEELRLKMDLEKVVSLQAKESVILEAMNEGYNQNNETSKILENLANDTKESSFLHEEIYDLLSSKDSSPIVRLLDLILSEAIRQKASDIHFEPFENDLRIRYRIDGVLQTRHSPAREYQAQLLTRIKVLANLNIAEKRLPQDGRIKLKMGEKEIDFRVSTIPVPDGERIVLRILDKGNIVLGLDHLGMIPSVFESFKDLIQSTEGIILVTGPTGSGKTTTLYSALHHLCSDETNIMTVEDPVEYKLGKIAQIPINPKIGFTFASGLRHILRQDPDIVMVGEIRDEETAEIAIQAALTGHLVFSTLHTNDAPSSITRLIDMGIEPYLLSSTIVAVLAQRLVRTICPHCRKGYKPTTAESKCLQALGEKAPKTLYKGQGCDQCFQTGFKGRHGLYEWMPISEAMQSLIAKKADSHLLKDLALKEHMIPLSQHGAYLVRSGITTLEEVMRVSKKMG